MECGNTGKNMEAQVLRCGSLDMQVCVPKDWTDEMVVEYAERANPSGVKNGWSIRRKGSKLLGNDLERTPCVKYSEFVHITLDA